MYCSNVHIVGSIAVWYIALFKYKYIYIYIYIYRFLHLATCPIQNNFTCEHISYLLFPVRYERVMWDKHMQENL